LVYPRSQPLAGGEAWFRPGFHAVQKPADAFAFVGQNH